MTTIGTLAFAAVITIEVFVVWKLLDSEMARCFYKKFGARVERFNKRQQCLKRLKARAKKRK